MSNRYAWASAAINVGSAGNIAGEINQWSRNTVADGKWMNNEQLLPLSGRDQYLLDSINDVYDTLTTNGYIDALTNEIERAKTVESELSSKITNFVSFKVVPGEDEDNHPDVTNPVTSIIYLVHIDGKTPDAYKEWIYNNDDHKWELIGDTTIPLDDYAPKTYVSEYVSSGLSGIETKYEDKCLKINLLYYK